MIETLPPTEEMKAAARLIVGGAKAHDDLVDKIALALAAQDRMTADKCLARVSALAPRETQDALFRVGYRACIIAAEHAIRTRDLGTFP